MGSECRNFGNELVTRCEVCRDDVVAKEIGHLRARLAACEEALVQARGALLLDHMVQDNGAPYGTTVVALDAIDAALKEPSRG